MNTPHNSPEVLPYPNLQDNRNWYASAMERLLAVVQELSQVRKIEEIMAIVKSAARDLSGADGTSFILREDDECYYADEDAISPLWKGKRFPMERCVSGWVMLNSESAVIEDIYKDPRVPADAYRPTFVKSMAVVPIRKESPVGAIGVYWASRKTATAEELKILQALADTTSVAIENAQLYSQLLSKVHALQESNFELSRFAWVASHDLQEPLRMVSLQIELLETRYGDALDERAKGYITMAREGAKRQRDLIESLLVHASVEKIDKFSVVDLNEVMEEVLYNLAVVINETGAVINVPMLPAVKGDRNLLVRLFQNLLSNAIKFQDNSKKPLVNVNYEGRDSFWQFVVEDNGIGIEQQFHQRIFAFFQRLHTREAYAGSGIGLATCKKIVELHGGRIWLESQPGLGSNFYFTLPNAEV